MIRIGQYNTLEVVKLVDFGVFLDGGDDFGNILLPKSSVPEGTQLGDKLEVFIYFDSNDEIIATTTQPKAKVGDFALLRVVGTCEIGAFVDWGLMKDLLVPFSEQRRRLEVGQDVMIRIYTDKASGRIVGSTKFNRFLDKSPANYQVGQEVRVTIAEVTDLGFKAVIEGEHWGLLFKTEAFGKLFIGKSLKFTLKKSAKMAKLTCHCKKQVKLVWMT